MQITVETIAPCRKRVRLVIPPQKIHEQVEGMIRSASSNLQLPGFRKGKVPRSLVEKRYGTAIRRDVKESMLNEGFQQALKDNNITPITTPQIDLEQIPLDAPEGIKVDFEFDARPEIDPKGYKGVAATVAAVSVEASEIDAQVAELRKGRRRPVKDEAGIAVPKEGFAIAKIQFLEGSTVILERESLRVMAGMTLAGAGAEEFESKLLGAKRGDTFDMPLTYPSDFEVQSVVGKPGLARVTIREVYSLISPEDAELLKDLDIADMETLRSRIAERLKEAKEQQERRKAEEEILTKVMESNRFELPERIIDEQLDQRLTQYKMHLSHQGQMPAEEIDKRVAEERAKNRTDFEEGMRRLFVLEAIAKKEKIFVTEEDMGREIMSISQRNNAKPEDVVDYYRNNGLLPALRIDILEAKVRNFLFENSQKS